MMVLDPRIANERFYKLLWPLRSDVLRLARMLAGNDADADDLAQETLLKAYSAIASFTPGTDARAWLMRILRNTRIDRIRSGAREQGNVSLDAAEMDVADDPIEENLEDWQTPAEILNAFSDQQMIDAMRQLPEEIRLTLLLVDVQQMDHKNAAEVLGVPVGTIKSRAHRGRAMLRQTLLPRARELRMAD